jgi:predicted PurR-regulated permease PerM
MSSGDNAYLQTFRLFFWLIAITLGSFYLLSSVMLPIIISFTLYALLEPVMNTLVRRGMNRSLAIALLLVLMLTASVLAISFALPPLFQQVAILKNKLPGLFGQFEQFITVYADRLGEQLGVELNVSEILVNLLSQSTSLGNTLLATISASVAGITLSMILVPLLTYFILRDYKSLRNKLLGWLPNRRFELGWLIYHRVTRQLEAYTRGVMKQSAIMAVVASIGFWLVGLDIPVLLGALTGLLNLIPYIGPLISMVLAVLVAAAMTPFEPNLIYYAIGVVVMAQVVDNIIVIPSVIANAVDLHPVPVIVGILIFGSLFGAIGVILAIPALAAAKIIFNNLYQHAYNSSRQS